MNEDDFVAVAVYHDDGGSLHYKKLYTVEEIAKVEDREDEDVREWACIVVTMTGRIYNYT